MGKSQSKRSVDITTEGNKPAEEEVTGKLEKIEDVDEEKQENGDASPQKSSETEVKVEADETENGKDLTTEKNTESQHKNESPEQNKIEESNESKDNVSKENSNAVEDISPLSEESIKKSKKDKVKKKWSFRSISFGKKDKQKPCKSEETSEEAVTNEEAVKPPVAGCDTPKESEDATKADETNDGCIVATKNNTNDDEISKPTKNLKEVVANHNVSASKNDSTATSKQTIDNDAVTAAESIGVVSNSLKSSDDNKSISEQSEVEIVPTTDIIVASEKVNDDLSSKLIDSCNNGNHNENGTTEPQTQHIEDISLEDKMPEVLTQVLSTASE